MLTASVSQLNRLGPLDSDPRARPACRARREDDLWTADEARRIVSISSPSTRRADFELVVTGRAVTRETVAERRVSGEKNEAVF